MFLSWGMCCYPTEVMMFYSCLFFFGVSVSFFFCLFFQLSTFSAVLHQKKKTLCSSCLTTFESVGVVRKVSDGYFWALPFFSSWFFILCVAVEAIQERVILLQWQAMTRGRANGNSRKSLVTTVLVLVIIGAFFYFYSRSSDSSLVEYGNKSLTHFGWGGDQDADESSSMPAIEGDSAIPKTIPVS